MESSSPASHMSPALCKTSSAGLLIKSEGKIPKKGISKNLMELKLNFTSLSFFIEFSPEDLLDALSPVLDMLYDQFPDCLPSDNQ